MVMSTPAWYLEPQSEDNRCERCSHFADQHVALDSVDGDISYPCGADEHFDIDPGGKLVLVDEPCPCEEFELK
jgi:hypothetical protein